MSERKNNDEEAWWKNLTRKPIPKRAGRRLEESSVAINKTTIAFGSHLVRVFKNMESVHIEQVLDKNEKLRGLIFFPKPSKSDGYTIRAPEDRQTIQIVLPKPIRPIFDQQNLYGIYAGEIGEHEDQPIVAVRFE